MMYNQQNKKGPCYGHLDYLVDNGIDYQLREENAHRCGHSAGDEKCLKAIVMNETVIYCNRDGMYDNLAMVVYDGK